MAEPKRCPFCGAEAEVMERELNVLYMGQTDWVVICENEDCNGCRPCACGSTRDEAIANWNKRYDETTAEVQYIDDCTDEAEVHNSTTARLTTFRGRFDGETDEYCGVTHGEWRYGNYLPPEIIYDEETVIDESECLAITTWARVNPETIGEFTGLADDHGCDIYEGDLLDVFWNDGTKGLYVVKRIDGEFVIIPNGLPDEPNDYRPQYRMSYHPLTDVWRDTHVLNNEPDCEILLVVGNIHDNRDMWEKADYPQFWNTGLQRKGDETNNEDDSRL